MGHGQGLGWTSCLAHSLTTEHCLALGSVVLRSGNLGIEESNFIIRNWLKGMFHHFIKKLTSCFIDVKNGFLYQNDDTTYLIPRE